MRDYYDDPPLSSFLSTTLLFSYYLLHPPFESYIWVWQEKSKGVGLIDTILGSTHGGWKFNTNAPYYFTNGSGELVHMSNSVASTLPSSQLQTNAFFDTSYDYALFNPNSALASAYAQASRNRILSDAIPAMTQPVGANPVGRLSPPKSPTQRNFNMMTLENGWPQERLDSGEKNNNWYHSDFHQVAYTFTYPLFTNMVYIGGLK